LRGILEIARKQGVAINNPAASVESPRSEHSIGMFSRPLKSKPFMTLLAKRGKRLGGMGFGTVSRSWREIDFATEVIDHIQRKTGRRVVVPLLPDDHEDRRAMIQKGMLMPKLAKFVEKSTGYVSRLFARVMAKARVNCGESKRDTGRMFRLRGRCAETRLGAVREN
jgi:hypothetical protein